MNIRDIYTTKDGYIVKVIIGLIIILGIILIKNCEPKPVYKEVDKEVDKEMLLLDIKNDNIKKEIIIKEEELTKQRVIEDSIIKSNKIIYKRHKDVVKETPDITDSLIDGLFEEIIIKDTIINILDDIIIKKDTIIHNLEIKEGNFENMLEETNKELVKYEKKNKRKNIIIGIIGIIGIISTSLLIFLLID